MKFKQNFYRPSVIIITLVTNLLFSLASNLQAAQISSISLVTDTQIGPAVRHGMNKVISALRAKGIQHRQITSLKTAQGDLLLVLGISSKAGPAANLHNKLNIPKLMEAESLLIRHVKWSGKNVLLVSGADDRGLMYALLDVADRIGWSENPQNPLSEVQNIEEKPAVSERALSIYTMHQGNFESYFYDETYWSRYLDMLAKNRFNTFALLFGYENWGYFSPPYPYFFDLDEFPDVKVVGITKEKQRRNLEALNRIIDMTHQRGLNFTLGIWDHIYRGGVQGPKERAGRPTEGIVWGLTADNLTAYTRLALTKFLKLVPNLDAIQFRMHGESGLKRTEMGGFWENVYAVMNEYAPDIRFDARAKNFPDSLIDKAVEMGVNMRICTKYWMEQMGLPFHPTHIHPSNQHDRRHGYADLLRYPQRYKMHWRLWTGGTIRVLLWGAPEYVRRFAESTHLYNGEGFEVTEPMATKMQDHPHEMKPFELLKPKYQYYDWEFERYWHFFQVFGRVGYNPNTPNEVWEREFQKRFGKDAGPYIQQALHHASKILPRIVAYNYPYNMFPTTRGWVGKQRMKDLPEYAKALPSDTQQFLKIDNAGKYQLEGIDSAQFSPEQSSRWFAQVSKDVLRLVEQAEQNVGEHKNKEFDSTVVDLKILAYLALYHSHRAKAGLNYSLFKHSGDINALDDAIKIEGKAIAAWGRLVESAGDFYHENLMMGRASANLTGHWRDELPKLKAGLDKLLEQRKSYKPRITKDKINIAHVPIRKAKPSQCLTIRATVSAGESVESVKLSYRIGQEDYKWIDMKQIEPFIYHATIKAEDIKTGLNYMIEASERNKRARIESVAVTVTADNDAPLVKHKHITSAKAGKPLTITAQISDPAGVKWVRLLYRNVTQFEDYKTLDMTQAGIEGEYKVIVPGRDIDTKWDFMYLIEIMDNNGNGAIYPDMENETPYIIVKLDR
ncbi:hypothetical protein ACFL5F_01000 [Planctomycetota bacterium]